MPNGYNGKILHVDLTSGAVSVEEPPETFYRKYLGGQGIGMYYILKEVPVGADPLGPENVLAVTLSVVTGVAISGQSRVVVNAKSPVTKGIGASEAGGFWPAQAKAAGFDAIIIRGKADKPVYLWLHDGEAELRDASHLWGRITADVERAVREELGDSKIEVMQIGPAGERLVSYACILNMLNRANGRTGMGAVMGSKNLKAIVVRGRGQPDIADREALRELARWGKDNLEGADVYGMHVDGTAGDVPFMQADGGLPTHNFDSGVFHGYEAISGQTMTKTILKERDTCFACIVRCKRVVKITEGPYQVDPVYGGPEYETIATLGSCCDIDDLAAISKANEYCNMYGIDTISTGMMIAWAMDCYERGLITSEDTGGLELTWGNAEAMVRLTELIGKREGFGEFLAEGMDAAAEKLGPEAQALAVACKGNPLPAHMPRVKRLMGLHYAVNPFGADHMTVEHDPNYVQVSERIAGLGLLDPQPTDVLNAAKVRFTVYTEQLYHSMNCAGVCMFVWGPSYQLYGPNQLVDMVRAVTGWDFSLWELMKTGERSLNMMREFNAREGFTSANDCLPAKLFEPLTGGPTDGVRIMKEDFEAARSTYYAMCGWDAEGRPTRAKLDELGLSWLVA